MGRLGVDTSSLQKDQKFLNTDMALDWLGWGGGVGRRPVQRWAVDLVHGGVFADGSFVISRELHAISDDAEFKMMPRLQQISEDVRHYMVIKTWISLISGSTIALACWGVGVKYPLLWGILAGVCHELYPQHRRVSGGGAHASGGLL